MTNDYKKNLLEYLTGNITEESKKNTPFYEETSSKDWNEQYIGYSQVRCKDGNGNYNGKILCYTTSVIALVDGDMNIIKTFTSFSTGTPFGTIRYLNVAEDGTIYGVDVVDVNGVDTLRVILLNNVSEIPKGYNDYEVILRNSYYFQGYTNEDNISTAWAYISKSSQSALYYISVYDNDGGDPVRYMPLLFEIKVGLSNTWTRLPDINRSGYDGNVLSDYFDEENAPHVKYWLYESGTTQKKLVVVESIGDNNPVYTTILNNTVSTLFFNDATQTYNVNLVAVSRSYSDFYLMLNGVYTSSTNKYKQRHRTYLFKGSSYDLLFEKDSDDELNTNSYRCISRGVVLNECLCMYLCIGADITNIPVYVNLIAENNNINYLKDTGVRATVWSLAALSRLVAFSNYNLYKIYHIIAIENGHTVLITTKIIYNNNNYNGEEYTSNNMLSPRQGLLFDENNEIIFARNLYNKKVYSNQTMSVINVPYNMLNDDVIAKQDLYSETNMELIENTNNITKNIYEDLYINFINALTMNNQNTDVYISNISGASRLNNSVSKDYDYENAKASKIRINYEDDTNKIMPIKFYPTRNYFYTKFALYVNKTISSIDFISEDESTVYNTINPILEISKFYSIKQRVRIDEIIPSESVLYDNIQVQYNGEDVIY